jgi:hypothetical protein
MSILQLLIATVCAAIGLYALVALVVRLRHFVTAMRTETWTETPGRILESHLSRRVGGLLCRPEVSYEYAAGGTRYVEHRISAASELPISANAWERLQMYSPGRRVSVFYDPKHPSRAVLERTGAMTIDAYMIGLVFVILMAMYGLAAIIAG